MSKWPKILVIHLFSHELFRIEFTVPEPEEKLESSDLKYDLHSTTGGQVQGIDHREFGIDTRSNRMLPSDIEAHSPKL